MSKSLLFIILFCIVSLSVSAALISYWDFNTNVPENGVNWAQHITSSTSNGNLNYTYTTAVRAIASAGNYCFHLPLNYPLSNQSNKYCELDLSSNGYKNLTLSFDVNRTGSSFLSANILYSTDGIVYTQKQSITFSNTTWESYTVDFSDISLVNNSSTLKIRIATGVPIQVSNYFRYDNIQITGEPISTLPVEFSGMSVTPGTNNNAYITWTTQSETGVNGFYVLRGSSDLLSEAEMISPLIPAANTSSTQTYFFADDDLPATGLYYYWLQSLDYNGEISYFGPQTLVWSPGDPSNPSAPLKTGLSTLYPNPFNPSLTIAYALEEPSPAQIVIYNLRGQAVHSIDMGRQVVGEHKFVWNGTSDRGEACPSGVYRIVLHAGKVIDSRKVLLLK